MAKPLIRGEVLRSLREQRGWDQQTLADNAGVNQSVISRLERGMQDDFRVSVLLALAQSLEVPLHLLLVEGTGEQKLGAELAAAIASLDQLSPGEQRHLAALLRAYVVNAADLRASE